MAALDPPVPTPGPRRQRARSRSDRTRDQAPCAQLGLGCVTFGREIDRDAAFAMMDHAVANGVTFFDTAAAYGGGSSETIVGEWLGARGARARVTLATKILPPYTPSAITAAVDASLRRLGVADVDVLFLHRWDDQVIEEATLRALEALVRDNRVRQLGASNFSAPQLESALARQTALGVARFQTLQNIHNYAVRGIDEPIRETCRTEGISIVTYSPLGAGFLTGKHTGGVQPGSRFELIPGHQPIYFNDPARRRLDRLNAVAARTGVPNPTAALAWALHQPQVDTVLVGGRSPAHLDQAIAARTYPATADLLRELDSE